MNTKTLEAIVASPPEREELVIQFFIKDADQWGELVRDNDRYVLEVYPSANGSPWKLDLAELQYVLQLGKEELSNRLKD